MLLIYLEEIKKSMSPSQLIPAGHSVIAPWRHGGGGVKSEGNEGSMLFVALGTETCASC